VIRHLFDGSIIRLKSNAMEALSVGEDVDAFGDSFGWAAFSGKATYYGRGFADPIGNYRFVIYVEDHGTPGAGADRFWVETD